MSAIKAIGLSKAYGSVLALRDVSFSVDKGEIIGLLGPNGAGKTTLMKILTGYLQADKGTAEVAGIDVGTDALGVQARIGYLPENAPLYRDMTVAEYLMMIASLRSIEDSKRGQLIAETIEATGLGGYLGRPIGYLSKGYRQRVGIAQALLHKPEILILDEPTTGLDPNQIIEIRDLIKSLSEHSTIMLSTHILPEVEMTCERVLVIMQGQLRKDSLLSELRAVNAAVVSVEKSADGVDVALRGIAGVDRVEPGETDGDYKQWRVTSDSIEELCPAVYQAIKKHDWKVAELRSDTRTLESVFRELAELP